MNRIWINALIFTFVCALTLASLQAKASTLEKLEAIADEAQTVEEFLDNPELIERYFRALKAYLQANGSDLPRKEYDAFLNQLRLLCSGSKTFANRIWTKQAMGLAHEIISDANVPQVRHQGFSSYWEDFKGESNKNIASQIPAIDEERLRIAIRILEPLDQQSKGLDQSELAEFFKNARARPEVRAAVLAIGLHLLSNSGFEEQKFQLNVVSLGEAIKNIRLVKRLNGQGLPAAFGALSPSIYVTGIYPKEFCKSFE